MQTPNNKPKYFRNPERGKPQMRERYVPQYQLLDIDPVAVDAGANLDALDTPLPHKVEVVARAPFASFTNPRMRPPPVPTKAPVAMPYAEEGPDLSLLPNVGSEENGWTSLDNMTFDETGNLVEPDNQSMTDNNVDDPANYARIPQQLPTPRIAVLQEVQEPLAEIPTDQINIGEGVLVVKGEIVSVASLEVLRDEVEALMLETHPLSKNNKITLEDIVVLKRISIKAGVFLE